MVLTAIRCREKQKPPDGGLVEYDQQAAPIGTAKNTRGKWVRS
jgi:hypothetical protein